MDERGWIELLAVLLLILANALFALSKFSIVASRKIRLERKVREGKPGASTAVKLNTGRDRFLGSIQVVLTLITTLVGVLAGATLAGRLENTLAGSPAQIISSFAEPISVGIITVVVAIAAVLIGELIPKHLALSNPESFACRVAGISNLLVKLFAFAARSLEAIARLIVRIFGTKNDSAVSEKEIDLIIHEAKDHASFDDTEEELIRSVFDFAGSTVRRAMTPRTDVVGIEINARPKDIIRTIVDNGYSRYPVFEKTIDNIIGILYTKDIIIHRLKPDTIILKDLVRRPIFMPDSMPLTKLLKVFQRKKKHIAIVLDEFGGTAGIITLEDILEELVGDIQDEYDTDPAPLVKHSDTVAYADGSIWPGEVNELMDSNLPEDKAETLAGLFIDHLGRLPEKNESIDLQDMTITLLEREENRLIRLKLEKRSDDNHEKNP